MIVPRRFVWKFFVSQTELRTTLAIEKFHRNDAAVVFQSSSSSNCQVNAIFLPGGVAVFARYGQLFTFRVGKVPAELALPHVGDQVTGLNIFRTEPLR